MRSISKYELNNLIIDIDVLNENDSVESFVASTSFYVSEGIENFLSSCEMEVMRINDEDKADRIKAVLTRNGKAIECFLITDNRHAADIAKANGIGIAVYTNNVNNASDFKEALYCIDHIADMSDVNLNRMYDRYKGIPWIITETERFLIREIELEDLERLYEIYADEETKKYIEDLYDDKEQEKAYTKEYIDNQYRFYEYGIWGVIDKRNNTLIGRAGIFERENQDTLEMGFLFEKKYWGCGVAKEVLEAVMQYAKEELDVSRLLAHTRTENVRAKRLLEKLSFVKTGEKIIDNITYDAFLADI